MNRFRVMKVANELVQALLKESHNHHYGSLCFCVCCKRVEGTSINCSLHPKPRR